MPMTTIFRLSKRLGLENPINRKMDQSQPDCASIGRVLMPAAQFMGPARHRETENVRRSGLEEVAAHPNMSATGCGSSDARDG